MNRLCWWLVERLSRRLDPSEREAVLGDIAESGANGREALRDLIGLAVQRQAVLWSEVWAWVAVGGLIVPVGIFVRGLSLNSWFELAVGQVQMIARQGVLGESGMTPGDDLVRLVCAFLLIGFWAGTAGFVMGSMLRRSAWAYAGLACCVWLLGFALPLRVLIHLPQAGRGGEWRAWTPIWWLTVQMALIVIPFLWGVRSGVRLGSLSLNCAALVAAAMAVLTFVLQVEDSRQALAYEVWRNGESLGWQMVWTPQVLPFLGIVWQFGLMSAGQIRYRRI